MTHCPIIDLGEHPEDIHDDIGQAIRWLAEQYKRASGLSPRQINQGQCDNFASDLQSLVSDSRLFCSEQFEDEWPDVPGHCWVEFEGKWFDAETPDGVDEWKDLPIFVRFIKWEKRGKQPDFHGTLGFRRPNGVRVRGHLRRA